MLFLANKGVDVLRLDAAPFLWKREGTNCQNQPEAHLIVQALRGLVSVATPSVAFKVEAIVAPDELVTYLGAHEGFRREGDIAYNNQLMVMLWSALASRDTRLATAALGRMKEIPPDTAWVTYLRCHDDIGWAVSDEDAASVGLDPVAHRAFLSDYFSGAHPGSFAVGQVFQHNPRTGDRRISGTAAALSGLQRARATDDPAEVDLAVRRLLMLYAVVYSFGGIPLLYMGDEIGLPNDPHWADDPLHATDNRWLHRPPMDWGAAEHRHDPSTVEGRIFAGLQQMAAARAGLVALRAGSRTALHDLGDPHLLAYSRRSSHGPTFLGVANFSDEPSELSDESIASVFSGRRPDVPLMSDHVRLTGPGVWLPPWGWAWLASD
jgi:amylosucrase